MPPTTSYMLTGEEPGAERTRALETYLNTVVDHGLNASTFAARVIIATQSDLVSAIVGAVGALKGPLHGGAPGPALDMVFEIGTEERAEAYLREKLERGERLMGFGHRIYKVRDPRADVLAQAAATTLSHRRGHGALCAGPACGADRLAPAGGDTNRGAICKPTWSSIPPCCCTAWTCRQNCSRPPSLSGAWRAGSPTASSSSA